MIYFVIYDAIIICAQIIISEIDSVSLNYIHFADSLPVRLRLSIIVMTLPQDGAAIQGLLLPYKTI